MPTIAVFDGISIEIYYNDHPPPHFHACYGEDEAVIEIATLRVMAGNLPPPVLRKVRSWASLLRPRIAEQWEKARNGIRPEKL